ncbi:MAG TPA: glycosyltransferase family 39 protein [Tepidisphaeraceae bacterium]|nr:glycosyltransferase family 39 protein [Tepidisphaeraceae bacterium]
MAIFFLALFQFCLFLDRRDITTAHEGRVAATAREMLASDEWLIPRVNDQLRLQKPPLPYWAAAGLWSLAGSADVWLARLPGAVCGAIATLLVMDLARLTLGRRAAWAAGMIWLSTWFVVDEYRKAMADPYLAFFALLAVWAWVRADLAARVADPIRPLPAPRDGAPQPRVSLAGGLLLLAYLSAACGTLAKGPVVLLHLAMALLPYHLIHRCRPPALPLVHAVGVILFLAVSLAWPLQVARHVPDAWSLWRSELAADRAASGAKTSSIFHYVANLPVVTAPWTVLAGVGAVMSIVGRGGRDRRAAWPLAWLGLTVLAFSLVPMKKNTYLLPAMPVVALLAAAPVASILRARRPSLTDRWLLAGHALAAVIAVAVVSLLAMPLPLAAVVILFVLAAAWAARRQLTFARTFAVTAVAFAVAVHVAGAWLVAREDNRRSDRPFAHAVNDAVGSGPLYLVGPGLREDVLFYLGRTLPRMDSIGQLPADLRGHAIVTSDHLDAARRSPRAVAVAESAPRPRSPKDQLGLFAIEPIAPTTAP